LRNTHIVLIKRNNIKKILTKRKAYQRPMIQLFHIELECGIAAGSATVLPQNNKNEIFDEWETVEEPARTIDW